MEAIEISTKPHHNALTEASRSHFPSIHDALAELIDNSIQACEGNIADAGRRVHIGCFLSEEKLHGFLTVMDNGCGMDETTAMRMFEPFYSTKPEGSGLGLPTTRKIIEAHGGRISVQSEVGRGTKFVLEFPTPVRIA